MAIGQYDGQAWVKDDSCWCPAGPILALLGTRFQVQQGEVTQQESIRMVQTWTLPWMLSTEETMPAISPRSALPVCSRTH